MTTKIIDLTQPGGSAGEFEKGTPGYFWDVEGGLLCYGVYDKKDDGKHRDIHFNGIKGCYWKHFSPTLPEWAKVEQKPQKPIELVKLVEGFSFVIANNNLSDFEEVALQIRDYRDGFDVIKCTSSKGTPFIFLGHWNDGVV